MALSKRQKKIAALNIEQQKYELDVALEFLAKYRQECTVKFDESVEISCNLGVDPRQTDQVVRGAVSLPAGTGKAVIVAVFTTEENLSAAKKCGADIVGSTELIEEIARTQVIAFDKCVATPDFMPQLAKISRILGPKGLMPNPKLGTVTSDVDQAVKEIKGGKVEFKTEKSGIVHAGIGKLSFSAADLHSNIKTFLRSIADAKPSGAKGDYFKAVYISTTMGPSIELDIKQLIA